jgi:hypothetical protein
MQIKFQLFIVPNNNQPIAQQNRIDLVCDACEELFDEVKQLLVDVALVSEAELKDAIDVGFFGYWKLQ